MASLLRVELTHPSAKVPSYATTGAAAFDLSSCMEGTIPPKGTLTVSTGLKFDIPTGFVMLVYSRSGHGFKNDVRLANCTGVIDSDYTGNVMVKLTNDHLNNPMTVNVGDRIAQAIIMPAPQYQIIAVDTLNKHTDRGENGFGSTGVST